MRHRHSIPVLIASMCALMLAPAAQADTATIGMTTFASTPTPPIFTGQNIPVFQGAAASNYVLASPTTGTIVSWSFLSGGVAPGKTFALRVLRPAGAGWTAVATSGPAAVSSPEGSDITQGPFLTSLPVQAGDRVALQPINDGNVPIETGANGSDGIRYFDAPFADGSTAMQSLGSAMNNGQVIPVQATVQPASAPPPAPQPPQNQVLPSITGTPAAGQTLTCDPGGWGGTDPITFSEVWTQRVVHHKVLPHHRVATVHVNTQIGTGPTVVVPDLPPDTSTITCTVTAQSSAGTVTLVTAPLTIQATKPVLANRRVHLHLVPIHPVITLGAGAGALSTCSTGTWLHYPARYRFDWYAGRHAKNPVAGKRIVSHRQSYRLHAADARRWLVCRVIAYNAAGHTVAFSGQVAGH